MRTIAHILHRVSVGGAEILACDLAKAFGHLYRFVFVCLDEVGGLGDSLQKEAVSVTSLGRSPGLDLGCARRLARTLRRERVELVHAHQYTPFFYSLLARFFGRSRRVIFTEHGRFHPDYPRRKRMLFNRALLGRKDRVIAVGEAVRRALIDNEGIPPPRVDVIYNGIDVSRFGEGIAQRQQTRHELGLHGEDFAVLHVARLDPIKDHVTAIEAACRTAAKRPRIKLLLVGDGPERSRIEQAIEQRGATSVVRLLGERSDVPRLLGAADAFLLTSVSEGIPLTILEAMAAGVPVVSTRVGGIPEIVEADHTACLAEAGDSHALAEHLLKLADDPQQRFQLGEAGRRRCRRLFSRERMHEGYGQLYETLLAG